MSSDIDGTPTFEIEADEVEVFLQDVNEHLLALETGILRLERGADPDTLNAAFRAAHTIKAVAATVGHARMAELTHALETLFDVMREAGLSPTQAMADQLLASVDALKALRDEVATGQASGVDADALLARLSQLNDSIAAGEGDGEKDSETTLGQDPTQSWLTPEQATQARDYREQGRTILEIEVTASADAFAPNARLLQAAMALAEVGYIIAQHPSQDGLAGYDSDESTDAQASGHLWAILATQQTTETIEELLSDVPDLAQFRVHPYSQETGRSRTFSQASARSSKLSEIPTSQQALISETVRISVERLDNLMNLVGELVTDRTRLTQITDVLRAQYGKDGTGRGDGAVAALGDMITHFDRVVDQLQEEVMQARMLPIAHLFNKFPRLVRDVGRAAGKQINLIIEGEATELDRSVIEVIGDPLIHLLRNAVDHGIELPQDRIAAGKPPTGTIWLTATHEEGHIVIIVKDDGQGIDPERIRQAAVDRGLLSQEEAAQLDDDATISLIFQPSLSTAEQVTDVSGRGVGLDVVNTNIKRLSGSVTVESTVGHGTTFRVTLPLTLAIVQAMMIALGDDVYAIPLTSIVESLYLSDVTANSVRGKPVIHWRDQVLPLLPLRQVFAHPRLPFTPPDDAKPAVVTVAWGKLQIGLIVDRLIGKQEIVIKSLGPFIGNVPGLSGCTILGDGRIALIVDIPGLISTYLQAQR